MARSLKVLVSAILIAGAASMAAQSPAPLAALARMPIREVTIFKDGHAFVLHEGSLPTDGAGHVLMDYLPTPVLGTFWPYTSAKDAKLTGVVAGQRRVLVEETALTIPELIAANAGAEAIFTERGGAGGPTRYAGTIVGIPERSSAELAATGLPNAAPRTPERGAVVMIRTADGIKVVAIEAIQDITFKAPPKPKVAHEEFRNLLTLQLDWAGRPPAANVPVGLVYVQRGLRWIPNYRVAIDGKGSAALRLQATLINELAGFEDATANLVIGVPSFAFQDSLDPIALQQAAAQLSSQLQPGARMSSLSNSIMSQVSFARGDAPGQPASPAALGPDVPEGASHEDLFVFTVRRLSMKKGERVVAPVADYTLPYKDVFTLDIPFAPPPEVRGNLNSDQEEEMARALGAPQVAHKIRLNNQGKHPLTTAPALILRDDRVLAQGLMTYTAIGGSGDLEITKAPDIQVKKSDSETGRVANGRVLDGDTYARINLSGRITVTNYRDRPVEIEVTRQVLGNVTTADHGGVVTGENVFENAGLNAMPRWWRWYSWPSWWSHFNGMGRITWKLTLEPRKPVDLVYAWHYFWR